MLARRRVGRCYAPIPLSFAIAHQASGAEIIRTTNPLSSSRPSATRTCTATDPTIDPLSVGSPFARMAC
jgi:hypothetical protein